MGLKSEEKAGIYRSEQARMREPTPATNANTVVPM